MGSPGWLVPHNPDINCWGMHKRIFPRKKKKVLASRQQAAGVSLRLPSISSMLLIFCRHNHVCARSWPGVVVSTGFYDAAGTGGSPQHGIYGRLILIM